jgi:Fe-S cluster assembly protein SufD
MNEKINLLPVPTWNRMGVNWAEAKAELPKTSLPKGKKAPYADPIAHGIKTLKELPSEVAKIPTGMGSNYDEYILDNADKTCFIHVNADVKEPFVITEQIDPSSPASRTHFGIVAERDSRLTVVQINKGDAKDGAVMSLTQILAKPGSFVRLIQIQLLGAQSRSWESVGARVEEGAKVELVRAVLGGSVAACGSLMKLVGPKSEYTLSAAYFGHKDQYLDFNDTAEHLGRESTSDMYTSGVLADKSNKILRGTIDFRSGAVRSVGHVNENVLLLNPTARNRTAPLILCGEEQVEGQHAATLGRFDEKQLYYLCSRGLTPTQAKRLMVEARFMPVLDLLPDEDLRSEILEGIERRLDSHENNPG